jgi:hypothetical protein
MAELHEELAAQTGLEAEQAKHGVGALLALLKERLSPEAFGQLKNAIPNAEQRLAGFQGKAEAAGLLERAKGMAGKLIGRGDVAALQEHFAGAGLSADKLQTFLPRLYDLLAAKLPPNVLDQIKQHVPGFGPAPVQAGR